MRIITLDNFTIYKNPPQIQGLNQAKKPIYSSLIETPSEFNQTTFALSTEPIMDSIISNSLDLVYPLAANTWECPHKFGLIVHSTDVELNANFFENTLLELFNNQHQQNIQNNLPQLRWIRQIYTGLHDIGKAYRAYQIQDELLQKNNGKNSKAKNKELELIATQIIMFKNMFGQDLNITEKLDDFIQKTPDCIINKQGTPEEKSERYQGILEEFAKLDKECRQEIGVKLNNLKLQNPQDVNLFNLITILLEDVMGNHIVEYVISNNDKDKKNILKKLQNTLDKQFHQAKKLYPKITKEQLVFLRISNFVSDISYYVNLYVMYFDDKKQLLHEFSELLKILARDTDIDKIESLPKPCAKIYVQDENSGNKNILNIPVKHDFWLSTEYGGNLWSTSLLHAESVISGLSYFIDVKHLTEQLKELHQEAQSRVFKIGYQENKALMDIITSQNQKFNNSVHNPNIQEIMAHMASADILNNLSLGLVKAAA